jgi:tripartite-type tricarboxylate transporter receptor subunit TctC
MRKLLATVLCLLVSQAALGQAYPAKLVRLINPYAAGGPSELVARELVAGLSQEFGQQVIIESKPGGGTVIAADFVAKSAPDGYTLLLATAAPLIVNPLIMAKLPYDPQRDLVPVGMFATVPNLITVHPSVPANNIRELIELAKKEPGKLNYASAGIGTGPHLAGELFKRMANVDLAHIAFKGAAPAVPEVLAGRVQVSFLNISPQMAHVRAGKLRPLAIASAGRSSLLPEVPTVIESGLANFIVESWNGIAVPAGTPRPVVETLSRAIVKAMNRPEAKAKLQTMGAEATPMGHEEFTAYIKADAERLTPIIKALDMKPN